MTQKDVEIWDKKYEIQKCLGKKKEPDNKFLGILNNIDNDNHEKNTNKNFFSDISNNSHNNTFNINNNLFIDNNNSFLDNSSQNYFSNNNNNVIGLIEDIDKLHFDDNENNNKDELKNIFNKSNWSEKKDSNEEKKNEEIKEKELNKDDSFEKLSIEEFFEKVQKETNIPNNIKKKLINAFKKKGILNVKILILFYKKYKNWDFLIQKFKKVTSQIEGVALCIEFLLKLH